MVTLFVLAFLCNGNEVLLVRRHNASFGNGLYSMVGGKVEQGERGLAAIKREVQEETGLEIPESSFELVHTFHRKGLDTELIALCFKADIANMSPVNNEPEKHDDMKFFNMTKLPSNIIPAHKQAIEYIKQSVSYSEHGWNSEQQ